MAKIKTLRDKDNTKLYPVTTVKAVIGPNGEYLDDYIDAEIEKSPTLAAEIEKLDEKSEEQDEKITDLALKIDNEVEKCDETCEEMKDILDSNFAEFSIGSDGNLYVSQGSYHDATYTITSDGNLVMNY